MSAFPAEELLERGQLDPGAVLLSKPFGRRELAAGIRHVLGWDDPIARALLVVDDSDLTRRVLAEYLESRGYRTFSVRCWREAEELLQSNPSIGLLVTDVFLPDGNGRGFVNELRKLRPELKVIFMSSRKGEQIDLNEGEWFLPKPVDFLQLGRQVEEAMGAAIAHC
jgi:CheY-like chemotaxis protein